VAHKFAQGTPHGNNNNSTLKEAYASPERYPSSSIAIIGALEKELNSCYTKIWESTIAY
jgi:hypothetical protein